MRPIQQVSLDMEHVCLAKAYRLARKFCEPRNISGFAIDAVMCHPSTVQRNKLKEAAETVLHPDATPMFRIKDSSACLICTTEPPVTEAFDPIIQQAQWQDFFETPNQPAIEEAKIWSNRVSLCFCKGSEVLGAHMPQRL